ncbi:uncharacterized protein TRUGW13939_01994 [Talaromyces rugulosus]|uniref:Uncharacterized protein n=1 Tax=Talaromyces rugulosus TaxID=121627 RepID=A0A7H8QLZ6_TALRU|nr:uncharacterized protein TRUGW13939_01994 [Talaromyces rugulosus]QKX54904.1 hypothetical protein TRUGW13939_01994 [Talaromyces rugulosus]
MSQDSDSRSQASLAPAAEIIVPSTPPRRSILSASPDLKPVRDTNDNNKHAGFCSPQPASSSEMTPPPSSQVHAPLRRRSHTRSRSDSGSHVVIPASPPSGSLEKSLYAAYGAAENLPTAEEIDAAGDLQLRTIAKDLLGVAQEARMSALHFKLQNSLLSFTSNEAIKKAEVEHQLARREVEILQSAEYQSRRGMSSSRTPRLSPSPQLNASLKRIEELERTNAKLEERLLNAKKLIKEKMEEGDFKNESLKDENGRLKKRIRDNREHLTRLLDTGSLSPSTRSEFQTPQRKSSARFPDSARTQASNRGGNHDAFATLLAADRVLHGDSTTLSPAKSRQPRHNHGVSHVRGAHSMSSFPTTPRHSSTVDDTQYITPGSRPRERPVEHTPDQRQTRGQGSRYDRDSTISASDAEEVVTDEDLPASQASSLATSMLRRQPEANQKEQPPAHNLNKANTLFQTKLFGQVRKAGVERPDAASQKRKRSFEELGPALKKPKDVGLGIDSWKVSSA